MSDGFWNKTELIIKRVAYT